MGSFPETYNEVSYFSLAFWLSFTFFFLQLNRATVHNPVTGKLEYANYRISKRYVLMYTMFCVTVMINNNGDDNDDDNNDSKNVSND